MKANSPSITALQIIKATEQQETLILVIEDEDAKKLLVAWSLYRPRFVDWKPKSKTKDDIWDEAWARLGYVDFQKLSDLSGLPFATSHTLFKRLRDCHLIFPDGTISANAMNIIRAQVGDYVRNLLPKGKQVPAKPPEGTK